MALVEPVPGEPAAVASVSERSDRDGRGDRRGGRDDAADERALLIADYHAGYEAALRYERGVEVPSRADERREHLLSLLERTGVDRLVVCGDLMHSIGDPGGAERGELEVLFESLPPGLSVTLVKGNHDGAIESWLGGDDEGGDGPDGADVAVRGAAGPGSDAPVDLRIVPGRGVALGAVGVCHGHTWPDQGVLEAEVVCAGHEHPCVRLEDEVGGSRVERAWLRGRLDRTAFAERSAYEGVEWLDAETEEQDGAPGPGPDAPSLIVLPAFNELVGGTWVNVADQSFLAPFLPGGLADGEAYLLNGTRLGPYRSV